MGRPIEIEIDAKTTGAERGIDNVGDSLERVGDRMDDVSDDAKKLDRDLTKALDETADAAKRSGREIGDSTRSGFDRAGEGAEEFKDEANSTAREAAASFDGSAESIVDAFQEVSANAFAGFGPAGAAAGLAAAAGIGVAMTALQGVADKANEATEKATELQTALSAAGSADEAAEVLAERWDEFATSVQRTVQWYDRLIGLSMDRPLTNVESLSRAMQVGAVDANAFYEAFRDTDAPRRLERLNDLLEGSERVLGDLKDTAAQSFTDLPDDIDTNVQAVADLNAALREEISTAQAAVEIEKAQAAAKGVTVEQYREQTAAAEEATQVQEAYASALEATADPVSTYEGILGRKQEADRTAAQATADATASATDSWEDYATAAAVSAQELIDEWNRQAEAAQAFQTNLATIAAAGGQALADELRAKGPEVASSVAEVIATADPATQRSAIEAHARATGTSISDTMASGVTAQGAVVGTAVTNVVGGISAPPVPVGFTVDASTVQRDVNDALAAIRPVLEIVAQVDTAFRRP